MTVIHKPKILSFPREHKKNAFASDNAYFQYYGMLMHQQNMLQDTVRTSSYHQAIIGNDQYFRDKVVLDVGAGSGVLSWFALQAGAKHVYCVEAASEMLDILVNLANGNSNSNNGQSWIDKITIIHGRIEDIPTNAIEDGVDIIISEPMGVLLLHERMIESYIYARDMFLKPSISPSMFPYQGTIYFCPFSDSRIYQEVLQRASFWQQDQFYQIDLRPIASLAKEHYISQPIIDIFSPHCLVSDTTSNFVINFESDPISKLQHFIVPLSFKASCTGLIHGIAGWFDVIFHGQTTTTLSTSPFLPRTHWYQIRFLFPIPIAVNQGQMIEGTFEWCINDHRSYDLTLDLSLSNTSDKVKIHQVYHLHEQQYGYLSSSVTDPAATITKEHFGLFQKD